MPQKVSVLAIFELLALIDVNQLITD